MSPPSPPPAARPAPVPTVCRRSRRPTGSSLIGALRNLDIKARPDLKRAVPALLVAILAFVVGSNLGGLNRQADADVSLFGWVLNVPAGWVIVHGARAWRSCSSCSASWPAGRSPVSCAG